jgi:hypothetical protein
VVGAPDGCDDDPGSAQACELSRAKAKKGRRPSYCGIFQKERGWVGRMDAAPSVHHDVSIDYRRRGGWRREEILTEVSNVLMTAPT